MAAARPGRLRPADHIIVSVGSVAGDREPQRNRPDANLVAVFEPPRGRDGLTADERPVLAAEIFDADLAAAHRDLRMQPRDAARVDLNGRVGFAADHEGAVGEEEAPVAQCEVHPSRRTGRTGCTGRQRCSFPDLRHETVAEAVNGADVV